MDGPVFRPVADHAILVDFGDSISAAVHEAVLRLDQALTAAPFVGFTEAVPAFVNLLVDFDPSLTDHATVESYLRQLLSAHPTHRHQSTLREVLACYDGPFAPDLDAVARLTGLGREAVINAHLAGRYEVYMYGFAPGYAYLAGVPVPLQLHRKPSPLRGIAAGSVMIAGPQCLVTTMVMPTGWWIIGRSPTLILTGEIGRAHV